MDIQLLPPIKEGIRAVKGFIDQRPLTSLQQLKECISQGFGERPEVYGTKGHNGLDFVVLKGTPIFASHDGEASAYEEKDEQGEFKGYGKFVVVRDRVNNFKTEYCHFDSFGKLGEVKAGDVIGFADSTGFSTNHHLHMSLKVNGLAIDPLPYLVWYNEDVMNEDLVKKIYASWGLSPEKEQEGIKYWSGKPVSAMVDARLKDIQSNLSQLK